ncbi:hypothetical protein [Methyloglobulus morosus]|uniref:hypothetical protein n=1 Tax=Methyloglobulus morosus TaxID=1410681 RepID=UPI000419647D|nr:hypothetical protein [Methyloglobulus morosus]
MVRTANLASKLALPEAVFDSEKWGLSDEGLCAIMDGVHDQFDEVFSIFYPVL